jgi:hypothetical protein
MDAVEHPAADHMPRRPAAIRRRLVTGRAHGVRLKVERARRLCCQLEKHGGREEQARRAEHV